VAKLNVAQIRKLALDIVKDSPGGIRYGELLKRILTTNPETPGNTIQGSIYDLHERFPNEVAKPSRGLFVVSGMDTAMPAAEIQGGTDEARFYKPFADWLKNDLDEATISVGLGGAGLRGKWATPDVVGVYKSSASDVVKFPIELVSAEIKTDTSQPVVAFGQAIAYRLFSHKTYIVMPRSITAEDSGRLESLCVLFGVGLVLFDVNEARPNFNIRVRAQRFAPDMFYVNEFAERMKKHDPALFEQLFS
jgi:hypothetical protein